MKKKIHPTYHQASVRCACGANYTVGSTKTNMSIEVCSACHPLFTGDAKFLDTAGRIDRFKARLKQLSEAEPKTAKKLK